MVPGQEAAVPPRRKRISRKVFLRLTGSLVGAAALGACAPRAAGPGPHGTQSTQMVYQDWRTDYFSAMAQKMLEEFHATHPNIHVFFTPDPVDLNEKMMADFQAGTAPDVFAGCCEFFPVWAQRGKLLDLTPYVQADVDSSTINDWDPAQLKALQLPNGKQFALPKYHGALALYYNRDLFDRYGAPYPENSWTHDDYADALKLFVRDRERFGDNLVWGSMIDVGWDRLQVHVNGWGGHFVDPTDPTRSLMAEREAIEALQWVRDRMWTDRIIASRLDLQNLSTAEAFAQERVAMIEDGSWALMNILEKSSFRIGVASFPAGPVRKVTLATTDGFAIYEETRYPDAAWELVKFLISARYGRAMARAHLLQPARASLVEEWAQVVKDQYPQKAQELDVEAFAEGHIKGYSVTAEIFANQEEARRLAIPAWEQIFTLGRSPVSILRDVSERIQLAQNLNVEESGG
jgi:multiple sugar transport system substrate-binding protein